LRKNGHAFAIEKVQIDQRHRKLVDIIVGAEKDRHRGGKPKRLRAADIELHVKAADAGVAPRRAAHHRDGTFCLVRNGGSSLWKEKEEKEDGRGEYSCHYSAPPCGKSHVFANCFRYGRKAKAGARKRPS
jgi:hypothetical protein